MAKAEKERKDQTLNEIFGELEEVIKGLEAEDVSLEDSFRLYHSGMDMLKRCSDKVDKIEKQMLVLDEEGETHDF
ncbi:exodeoxyribonuclease VII small subunit [Dorea sp. D27]|uniref:exodeoxyribonuclease VII small subunit n=1 Tax=Dorea sp. D27 TaxID=658665 RepID=UPI000673745B|nr:exodeoxyribonuclease VII small subunit [Dorea sp. D27]KMZ54739.1 exodeoxyribonuclease VII, small subunit [Dorea sp. D27]